MTPTDRADALAERIYNEYVRPGAQAVPFADMRGWIRDALEAAERAGRDADDLATIARLTAERDELQAAFNAQEAANERAVARWQEATGRRLVLPDGAELRVWLMQRVEALEKERDAANAALLSAERDAALRERDAAHAAIAAPSFQDRVRPWMLACFGSEIAADKLECNHRFLEEALELVQACGYAASEAHQLVDSVYVRDQGDTNQGVGGVMVTLAALCLANGFDMHAAGEAELSRIWGIVERILAKQAAKPKHSPLPQRSTTEVRS